MRCHRHNVLYLLYSIEHTYARLTKGVKDLHVISLLLGDYNWIHEGQIGSPYMRAAAKGNIKALTLLLSYPLPQGDVLGYALVGAIRAYQLESVKCLLGNGATVMPTHLSIARAVIPHDSDIMYALQQSYDVDLENLNRALHAYMNRK